MPSPSAQTTGTVIDHDIVCEGLASTDFDARHATARDMMTEDAHCCREGDDFAC
jgi:hypothetical protein